MKRNRVDIISLRSVNQYRRRDIISYLALRYYLENDAARSNQWAQNIAVELVLTNSGFQYLKVPHFKEVEENGRVKHRDLFLPTANVSIAEAVLLNQCALNSNLSDLPSCVYSYELASHSDRSGVFKNYVFGLKRRQRDIANACKKFPNGIVKHIDIRNFYPSVDLNIALKIWQESCRNSGLESRFVRLGSKLIEGYSGIENTRNGLLVGPMFSHFLANLILRRLDESSGNFPVSYFRYVDDITLVGEKSDVKRTIELIRSELSSFRLEIHDENSAKTTDGPVQEWLHYKDDFNENDQGFSWMKFVGDLKRFLLTNSDQINTLDSEFKSAGMKIPVYDYSAESRSISFIAKFKRFRRYFRHQFTKITPEVLLQHAHALKSKYFNEVIEILTNFPEEHGFDRKSKIPKLRYRIGRLVYLADNDQLLILNERISKIDELMVLRTVIDAVITAQIDRVVAYGVNCSQAAAQIFKAGNIVPVASSNFSTEEEHAALAVFLLNGLDVKGIDISKENDFLKFAKYGGTVELFASKNAFIREIASLHGIGNEVRHKTILQSIVDEDEDISFDLLDQLNGSFSI